jgi:hypothetical protein
MRLGVREGERHPPRDTGDQPPVDADVPPQPLDVGDQPLRGDGRQVDAPLGY